MADISSSSAADVCETQKDVGVQGDAQPVTAEMDRLYAEILLRYHSDTLFLAKLRAAQDAWCRFRDAHIDALYPAEDKTLAYGSSYRGCREVAMATLTRQRIEQLRQWLEGVAEGDVCAGSLPWQ